MFSFRGRRALGWFGVGLVIWGAAWLTPSSQGQWQPAKSPLTTRWGRQLDPAKVWAEYPRPQLVREQWQNLCGLWDYAIVGRDAERPAQFDGQILVPFCPESALSGVGRSVLPNQALWYRREVELVRPEGDQRVWLHFGAVDWDATVWVNGREVARHRGGSTPFSCDVTEALKARGEGAGQSDRQEIVVRAWDPTDQGAQPRGKQVLKPEGIWYTAVTGIWQPVWTETVSAAHIGSVVPGTDISSGEVTLNVAAPGGQPTDKVVAKILWQGEVVAEATGAAGQPLKVKVPEPRLWTPSEPNLYDVELTLTRGSQVMDRVTSYVALRKISVGKDSQGVLRLLLNDEPLFHYGPLDQGWWPDGLLTPPSDEAMAYDLQVLKSFGMNMLRKHIKVEPSRYYYHCDRLGLLVWQDMPSGMQQGRDHFVGADRATDAVFTDDEKAQFRAELREMMDHLRFFPSIVVWVPFNEGWGQHDTNEVLKWVAEHDPSRLVNGPSGWTDRGYGAMKDMHNYPGPGMFPVMDDRVSVLGEFGGLGWPVAGHLWKDSDNWGYRTYKSQDELISNYEQLMQRLHPLVGAGLAAAVYTQTTDVEVEVNGLMTYDREVVKFPAEKMVAWHSRLLGPAPEICGVLANCQGGPADWVYTTADPGAGWMNEKFDASRWKTGPGGFGTRATPGAEVGTEWSTSDIWLRRQFQLERVPASEVLLTIHHDEDAQVYINGQLAADLSGYTTGYTLVPLSPAAASALRAGDNVISIHCHQTTGGQYIDAGLSELTFSP